MSRVEELKAALIGELEDSGESGIGEADAKLDAFAAAVAEQERERIRGESQMVGVDEDCIRFIGSVDNYIGAAFLVPVDVMDPPVLAPTKESEK